MVARISVRRLVMSGVSMTTCFGTGRVSRRGGGGLSLPGVNGGGCPGGGPPLTAVGGSGPGGGPGATVTGACLEVAVCRGTAYGERIDATKRGTCARQTRALRLGRLYTPTAQPPIRPSAAPSGVAECRRLGRRWRPPVFAVASWPLNPAATASQIWRCRPLFLRSAARAHSVK